MKSQLSYPKYRWVMLATLMALSVIIQMQWLAHAAVARPAEAFYANQIEHQNWLNIDNLALIYMVVYVIISLPVSWILARFGLRSGLLTGAVLTGLFSILKGMAGNNLAIVTVAQLGLAIAQPFILNSVTTLTDQWFPLKERALAAGLTVFSQFIGILLVMVITPMLVVTDPSDGSYGKGITTALSLYGYISAAVCLAALTLVRPRPAIKNTEDFDDRTPRLSDITSLLKNRDMLIGLFLFMVGLGIFNAISSLTDAISASMNIDDSDGLIATMMMLGGMVGSIVLPICSDYFKRRKAVLVLCVTGMLPGLSGLAFAGDISSQPHMVYFTALCSTAILGFFVLGAGPVGFQYIAEITRPVPEAFSQGMVLLVGQISGMALVICMSVNNHVWLPVLLQAFVALTMICLAAVATLKESPDMNHEC
ncbi:MFS transporter [Parendozoicomonas sp. Alg238-R29]|uniref:MFS transporter n=1 Tax=Parendozoicomonas sp. Alg238-R29 TaxID=2993446 RepID=UPI00248D9303|nr:MFS transporter [Parendozoicomonas sp. Alg238-R29]